MKLRLICRDIECCHAAHVEGAPAVITWRTFEVDAPPDLSSWMDGKGRFAERTIEAVEVVPAVTP